MLKKFSKGLLLVCLLFLIVVFVVVLSKNKTYITQADAGDKLTGWAYSSNIGWISFSSTTPVSYGVEINSATGDFSGYAWSGEMFGWIYFGPDATLTDYGLVASSSAPNEPKIWAKANLATGEVTGWAKILSAGNDGWIKMSDDSVSEWNGKGVKINLATGDFSGWAWNGDATNVGWISFNSSDCDQDTNGFIDTGSCAGDNTTTPVINYKVHVDIIPAAPSDLTAIPLSCTSMRLNWTDNSNNETGFQVQSSPDGTNSWNDFCYNPLNPDTVSCASPMLENTTYYFKARALGSGGNSAWEPASGGVQGSAGFCPPVLSVDSSNCGSVVLSWTYGDNDNVSEYEIWRDVNNSGIFVNIATTTPASLQPTIYADEDISSDTSYDYYVIARSQNSTSTTVNVIKPCQKLPKWQEVKPK